MSIRLRLALLLGVLLAVFFTALGLRRSLEDRQLDDMLAMARRDNAALIERWLDLTGQSLRQFASDYSLWDDTVEFIARPDPAWARINLEASLPNFNAHAIWVFAPDGRLLYGADREGHDVSPAPLSGETLLAATRSSPFLHFFAEHGAGLIEVRAAPVQPSRDTERTSPPVGWILVARTWDEAYLEALVALTECEVTLVRGAQPPAAVAGDDATVSLTRPLPAVTGQPLAYLQLRRELTEVAQMIRIEANEGRTLLLFGALLMVALALSLQRWVIGPLGAISESLETGNTQPIRPLLRERNELGRVAQLIEGSVAQQVSLRNEVEERRRAEEALRTSEAALRRTIEERVRLGRDLHDGVIQSIYAAGMGLAAARTHLARDPAEAERRIDRVRTALNDTIRELRAFINGLEPESPNARGFADSVGDLVEFLRAASGATIRLSIDETLADELPTTVRTGALQIIREGLSNSLRHGDPAAVDITLRRDGAHARLEIADDGRGFDLEHRPRQGQGLANMAERAHELDGEYALSSSLGKGTRIVVRFPLPTAPAV